jgi:nucleoid-associated protein YgaU
MAQDKTPPAPPADNAYTQWYEVQKGDTLSKIAKHFYGDPALYKGIFEANRDTLENPDRIFPGQKLRIP